MPVTLKAAKHQAEKWPWWKISNDLELLSSVSPWHYRHSNGLIQSSFPDALFERSYISPSRNGFVQAVYRAYSDHHHLVLRPEDVWFSILTQLSFFMNKNAEDLRSKFVAHQGPKKVDIRSDDIWENTDFGDLVRQMTDQMQKHIIDPDLRAWIMPTFSTSTEKDRTIAAILMMAATKKYFDFHMALHCGIPSVTLLGKRDDWQHMLEKLDQIPQLGEEPAIFASLLEPILKRFVTSFDYPSSREIAKFWSRIVHDQPFGSAISDISGWIVAFCFWDEDGKCLYKSPTDGYRPVFDGAERHILFHCIGSSSIPVGYASVSVTLIDNGVKHETAIMAGSVGIEAKPASWGSSISSPPLDTVQPVSGWWMYKNQDPATTQARIQEVTSIRNKLDDLRTSKLYLQIEHDYRD